MEKYIESTIDTIKHDKIKKIKILRGIIETGDSFLIN